MNLAALDLTPGEAVAFLVLLAVSVGVGLNLLFNRTDT